MSTAKTLEMDKKNKVYIIGFLLVAAVIGKLTSSVPKIAFLLGIGVFLFGVYKVFKEQNRDGSAHLYAAFLVGCDVFFRMSWAGLPWEYGKYSAGVLLLGALIIERNPLKPLLILLYLALLLPAMYMSFELFNALEAKKHIMFNLSGPLLITVGVLYFYNRKFSEEEFLKLSRWFIYGVFVMGAFIYTQVGDYSSVKYGLGSNSSSSGGFSGTQVAPVFAAGILLLLINLFQSRVVFIYKFIDIIVLLIFIMQVFFTFSRGGLVSTILAIFLAVALSNSLSVKKLFTVVLIPLIGIFLVFGYVDTITGGNISKRYFNKDEDGKRIKKDISTGRNKLVKSDLRTFNENILGGVGFGGTLLTHEKHTGIRYSSHNEYLRLLAEHGILGLISLFILLYVSLIHYFKVKSKEARLIYFAFLFFGLLEMSHGALRLALIPFIFSMAFLQYTGDEDAI